MRYSLAAGILFLSVVIVPAHAGWFDNLFGGSESSQTEPASPPPSKVTSQATTDKSLPLVSNVMGQLGLNQQQAEGGLGTLLNVAKSSLNTSQFQSLTKNIPGADLLLSAAPLLNQDSGASGLLSKVGDLGQTLQSGAMVYGAFDKLGISKDLVLPMVNLLKQYLQQHSGNDTVALLNQGLNGFL